MGGYNVPSSNTSINNIIMIITWSLLIPFAFPIIADSELGHICGLAESSSGLGFNRDFNLSRFFTASDLSLNTASNGGYKYTSYTYNSETTYGLASCRGDVSPDDCNACLNNATNTLVLTTHCPDARSAIIWRNYCVFKYSDVNFSGKMNTNNSLRLMNETSWPQLSSSIETVKSLMTGLTQAAIESPKYYASGNVTLPRNEEEVGFVYEIAQCARDLTKDGCNSCLVHAVTKLFECCDYKRGGHVVYDSCDVRYETYNFLNN